jgi:hypothetical protein
LKCVNVLSNDRVTIWPNLNIKFSIISLIREEEQLIEQSLPWMSESSGFESQPENEIETKNNFQICSALSPTRIKESKNISKNKMTKSGQENTSKQVAVNGKADFKLLIKLKVFLKRIVRTKMCTFG